MYTKKIIIVLYSILSFSLMADYYVKDQKIYYEGYDHKNGKFINYDDEVKNIDLDSFEQLNPFYARDNNTVYFRGKETDIDRNSSKIIRLNLSNSALLSRKPQACVVHPGVKAFG